MPNIHVISGFVDSDVDRKTVGTPPKAVAEFRVNDGSTWLSVVAWEDLADKVPEKGGHVIVHGRVRTRSFDGRDGAKQYRTETIASMIEQVGVESSDDLAFPD